MIVKDENKYLNIKGWSIVFLGGLFYMYQFALRVSPNIMQAELLQILSIDAGTLGTVIGVYYWAYTLMQIPLGMTMDRIGPRYFLSAAAFMCAFSCFIFGNTHNIYIAGGARFLMGMGSACGLIGTIKLGTIWIERKHIAKVTSLAILMGTVGAGLGGAPLRSVLTHYGLEKTMEMLALIGILVGTIIYISVRIHPPLQQKEDINTSNNLHPFADLMHVIRSKQAWIVALYGMLMYAPITIIGIAWGVSFIAKSYKISETLSASVVSTMFLGAAIGSPAAAFISDVVFKKRRLPMFVGGVISLLLWSSIIFIANIPLIMMYILFFFAGFAYAFKTLSFASICDLMPRKLSGISVAFVNMIVMSTGILFHPLIGHLIDYHWNGSMVGGAPSYAVGDYKFAFIIIPISLFLAVLLLIFMRESHPESSAQEEYDPAYNAQNPIF